MTALQLSESQLELTSKTIGMLAADAVEKANSGHPGMPMGAGDYAAVLWLKYLRFNPQDPKWLGRDRFVLSNGHGSMLLYGLLHLAGYDVSMEDLKQFRQWESKTPGHPESFMTPGVECTTGPLGQGIGNAVGMALGQRLLAERYGTDLLDHKVFCFCGDGCLMEGVSGEASSLGGHLGLGNLITLYDDNHISIAGRTDLAFTEDVLKRYEGFGWHVMRVDGHNFSEIDDAMKEAIAEKSRPSMIAAVTIIGKGSPNKADTYGVHGAPLGEEERKLTREAIGWPNEDFHVPSEVSAAFSARIEELKGEYDKWQSDYASWKSSNPGDAGNLEAQMAREVPSDLREKLISALPDPAPVATRKLSGALIQVASSEVSAVVGGSADLEPSTLTLIKDSTDIKRESFAGKNIRYGVREHGMGAVMNGLSYYGGYIPYGSTFLCFSDYMRPAIRLAALSHLPGMFIFTHDSVFLGEDGPTHQPIEHVNSLRMIPNLHVLRPADGLETAMCYEHALTRKDGPCALILTRQNLDPIERDSGFDPGDILKGAYVAYSSGNPDVVFVATGSETALAIAAAKNLSGMGVSVVSMPCWELFKAQGDAFREKLFPASAKKVVVEAGTSFGWHGMIGASPDDTLCVNIDRYGASAPAKVIAENLGFTPEAISNAVKSRFSI